MRHKSYCVSTSAGANLKHSGIGARSFRDEQAIGVRGMATVTHLNPPKAPSRSAAHKDLYGIGEIPPLGHVPEQMHAWVIRKERHGPPETSFQLEVVPTWPIGEDEVLVYVMAAGVNYNGVWAGLGVPISPLDGHKHPFHIARSEEH